jgi:AcrR family transcriptional regulator
MPRVSEEHLERRRRQILDAARRCFVRKGVHETSMQDIFAESGLSAGAVYRYFKSKNEIVAANLMAVVGDLQAFLVDLTTGDRLLPLDEILEAIAEKLTGLSGEDGPVRLAPQAWALAMYDADLADHLTRSFAGLREIWGAYLRRLVGEGRLPAGTDVEAASKTLFAIMPGYLLQRLLIGDVAPQDLKRGIRALANAALVARPVV